MKFKKLRGVRKIVIHCSATKPSHDARLKDIDLWHRQRGWLCCGYHIVICRDGTIEFGRPLDAQGAHVRGHNHNSVGICMVGGVDVEGEPENNFTSDQMSSLEFVLDACLIRYPLAEVVGHNELDDKKACPSFNVYEVLGRK